MTRWPGPALALTLIAGAALAHQGATGIVLERMEAMTALSDAMKVAVPMARGEIAHDGAALVAAAAEMAEIARGIPGQFPEGSDGHPSEAAPAIWEAPAGFAAMAGDLARSAEALARIAEGGEGDDDLMAAVAAIGAACAACHRSYRLSDD